MCSYVPGDFFVTPPEVLEIAESAQAAANACASWLLEELRDVVSASSYATIAISGGSTPKMMFDTFARISFPWQKVHMFWVDERCVPPDDSQSNFKLANDSFLKPASVPVENIHRILGEIEPGQAAARYVSEIREFFRLDEHGLPSFDVIHRGMGPDAHSASLFPGEPLIGDSKHIAAQVYVEKLKSHRVTLLPGVLRATKKTAMLVAGEDKAQPLAQVLRGPEDPFQFPCQIATRNSLNAIWFVDRAATARL
jgi:6-phosphogluconolactonase